MYSLRILAAFFWSVAFTSVGHAALSFTTHQSSGGLTIVLVQGEFELSDDLTDFMAVVKANTPHAIAFVSPGGSPYKAMELGRIIRDAGLTTLQPREYECASACALAFLGGLRRLAEPGAIGVHRSSFRDTTGMTADDAVAAIQQLTAETMQYIADMGTDPALLQLALQYPSDDIRYLSKGEMQRYRVITTGDSDTHRETTPFAEPEPNEPPSAEPSPKSADTPKFSTAMIDARSGRVRHPKGKAPLKFKPDRKSSNWFELKNGATLQILTSKGQWYRVRSGLLIGYMHHSWVFVDQFEGGQFDDRHVQVKSFNNLRDTQAYIQGSTIPLVAYLATNGWFAVALEQTFAEAKAARIAKSLKQEGLIPGDSFVTYGNSYVRKVCCH